jgi:hypothetical protein
VRCTCLVCELDEVWDDYNRIPDEDEVLGDPDDDPLWIMEAHPDGSWKTPEELAAEYGWNVDPTIEEVV